MTTATQSRRETHRMELAAMLDLDPAILGDNVHLLGELALDSLAMMRLLTWLEGHGVAVESELATVGEVLSLLDTFPGLSLRVTNGKDVLGPGSIPTVAKQHADPLVPIMSTSAFRLLPIAPDDMSFLYALAAQPESGFRWRYRGSPPPADRFATELWAQVLTQFVVRRTDNNQPVGHVVAYAADLSLRHAYLGALFHPSYTGGGLAAQATSLFVRYLFHTFPLRKLYMEVPGFNWPQMQSGQGRLFQVEGVFRDHDYYAGRYWDKYLCAIYPSN